MINSEKDFKIKEVAKLVLVLVLVVNILINFIYFWFTTVYLRNKDLKEIHSVIEKREGNIVNIQALSTGGGRGSLWFLRIGSSPMVYSIIYIKNGKQFWASYSYPDGYVLDILKGKNIQGRWVFIDRALEN